MRLLWVGTYERGYPRTRVLVDGLRSLGVEVAEHHRPVWERDRHKAGAYLAPGRMAATGLRFAGAWAGLAPGALRAAGPVDAVVAGYPAQPDAALAAAVARRHRAPLVVDMMISLADTLAGDRARVGRAGGAALAGADRLALRAADLVIADTHSGAEWLTARFGVPPSRLAVVPVGAEPERFPLTPAPTGPPTALVYGKLAPLHGIATVVEAARRPGVPPVHVIGEGQLGGWLARELRRDPPPGMRHEAWVPYEELGRRVAAASICLGVFGTSAKAARVVPNKVWQALAAGRPVVTADTPAAREVLEHGTTALLVPPGDPGALADALRELAGDADARARMGRAGHAVYRRLGSPEAVAQRLLDALGRTPARGARAA